MNKWIICDLDGTLANCSHRVPLLPDWDAFHAASDKDQPYPVIIQLLRELNTLHPILILTGTPLTHRGVKVAWLVAYGVYWDELSMRPESDYSPDIECKWNQAVRFFGSEEQVLSQTFLVIDDRDKVVEMWRNKGLTCIQPRLGDY